ncbi:bone sialoprotein 2 [Grammomys surdaster]|uniref:bone sialoprotein 2 n=1 Tax=Grammomys surdaster TaxID=491861 RepID=UPI0010A04968|nr:bone sialoprotein 2 [Grammomys surdaster]
MRTALILLSILGMACAFSMKNFHRRIKAEDSEENGVFKYRPRYFLYKHAYFYPPLKRFPVQGGSDSSEENGDGDSSEEEGEEEETSNEEENNEDSEGNEEQESEAENSTLSGVTASYGAETTAEAGTFELAALQLPKKAGNAESKALKKKESDEEEEEEEEENEKEEAEVEENEQVVNGTSTNSTEVDGGHGSSGGDNVEEEVEEASVTEAGVEGTTGARELNSDGTKTAVLLKGFQQTTPLPEAYGTTSPSIRKSSTVEYGGEYEQTGNEYNNEYEVYDNENGEPRGDTYRAYEDEYSYYKGHGYEGYEGQDYYYHQ